MKARTPLILESQPEGGYTVTSPILPELITEGETVSEAIANAEDAFAAVMEIYEDRGRPLPSSIYVNDASGPVFVETMVSVFILPCKLITQQAESARTLQPFHHSLIYRSRYVFYIDGRFCRRKVEHIHQASVTVPHEQREVDPLFV